MGDTVATPANNGIPGAINNPVPGATSIDENGVARDQSGKVLAQNVQTPTNSDDADPWGVKSVGQAQPAEDPWGVKSVGQPPVDQVQQALGQATGLRAANDESAEDKNPVSRWVDKKLHLPSTAQVEAWTRKLGQDIDNGTDQTWVGGALRWAGLPGLAVGTDVSKMPVASVPGGIVKLGHALAVGAQGHPVQAFNEAAAGAGDVLSPFAAVQPEALPFIASAGSAQKAATEVGKKLGLDEDSAQAIGTVVGLVAGGRTIAKGEGEALGAAANRSAAANLQYEARMKEVEINRRQLDAAQQKVDQARQAEQKLAGSSDQEAIKQAQAATNAAQTAASEQAANLRKSQDGLAGAEEFKRQAAVDVDKQAKKITSKAKAAEAADKQTIQSKADFRQAFPASAAAPYDETDLEVGRGYIEHQHKNVEQIGDSQGMYDALEASRQDVEDKVRESIAGVADQPLNADLYGKVQDALSQNRSVKDYAAKGMSALDNYNIDEDMNLGRADELRAQLNAELRGTLKEKKWSVGDAMAKDPEFAAKKILADTLRDSIYDRMDDLGIKNADVLRQDESSLIKLRDAVERQIYKGGQKVRGSGVSPLKSIGAQAAGKAIGGGIGVSIGVASGIPYAPEALGWLGQHVGGRVGERFAPGDLTRDQLAARIADNTKAALPPSEISTPAAYPVVGPTSRDFSPLHKSLATHYGEVLGKSAYSDLENRFLDDISTKQQHGVELDSNETKLLDQLNDQHMKDMWDAHEQVQKSAIMQEQPVEPTLPRNFEPAQEIEGNVQAGMGTHEALVHDMAHHVVANELLGDKLPSLGIASGSHAENMAAGSLASAQFDWSHYIDEDGNFDMKKVEKDLPQLTAMYVAGGAANDLYHGIPMSGNHHLGADFSIIRELMGELGLTPAEQKEMIQIGGEHAAEILKRPGTQETLEAHARVREPNLDPTMHMSPERVQQILEDVKDANRESGTTNSNESANSNAKDAESDKESASAGDEQPRGRSKSSKAARRSKVADEEQPNEGNGKAAKGNKGNAPGNSGQSAEGAETAIKPESPKFSKESPDLTHRQTEKGGEVRLDSEQEGLLKNRGLLKYTNTGEDTAAVTAANLDKDFRGQGLGQKMYEEAANQARQAGKKYLTSDLNGQTSYEAGKVWDNLSKKYPGEIEKVPSKAGSPGYRWDLQKEPIKPTNPKFGELPPERTTGNPEHDAAIKAGGGIPGGIFGRGADAVKMFHDPQTKTTLGFAPHETPSAELTAKKIADSRAEYAAADARKAAGTQDWAANAAKAAQESSGFTVHPTTGEVPQTGYQVEVHPELHQELGHTPTESDIRDYAAKNKEVLASNPEYHIGSWTNPENGKRGLSISERIADRAQAEQAGKDRNQISIWNNARGEEIPTVGNDIHPGIKLTNPSFGKRAEGEFNNRVSTRTPEGKKVTEKHLEGEPLVVNTDAMPDKFKAKMADTVREYPGFKIPKNLKDPVKVLKAYKDQFSDNLKWLWDQAGPENQTNNAKWYESANRLVADMSQKHGLSKPQSAAIIAALSPGVDWNINVSLAQRLAEGLGKSKELEFTPEMDAKAKELIGRGTNDKIAKYVDNLRGKKYTDLKDTTDKATFLRLWDEAHNPREYHDIDPATGQSRGLVKNTDGSPAKAGWTSGLNPIEKAVSLHEDPSPENISKQLGEAHKIRNFYNNIIDPTNPQDVTIDTHAIAAGHLMPFSREADPVLDNFGTAGKNKGAGLSGSYAVNADAYRQAAADLSAREGRTILPREVQSVTWEKIRDMFPAEWKSPENLKRVQDIWKKFTDGKQSMDATRQEILDLSNQAKAETQVRREKDAAKAAKKAGGDRINALDFIKALEDNKAEQAPKSSGVKNALSGQANLFGGV